MANDPLEWTRETFSIHDDRQNDASSAMAPPIYQTSTFRAGAKNDFNQMSSTARHEEFYTRYGNPTRARAERLIARLEGAEAALLTSSGMGAMSTAVLSLVSQGDHVVAQTNHYGGTTTLVREILPKFGVEFTTVEQSDVGEFEKAVRETTKLIIVESPSNPLMKITDLRAVANLAKEKNILTLADNTFATPFNQRPVELGIDLVMHSATKYLNGHSDVIAGAIAGSTALLNKIWKTYIVLGTALSPFDSWLVLRGMRTLSLRVARQNDTAMKIARFLQSHPKVKSVNYPGLEDHPQHALARSQMSGFTGMLSFELEGGVETAERFINHLEIISCAASLGGIESLIVRPAAMLSQQITEEDFEKIGISPELLRLSVGLESEKDLFAELERALSDI